mgnify:CR=1 FL=1
MEVFNEECVALIAEIYGYTYAPSITNLMSYYSQTRLDFNNEQGARMRYYLDYRLTHNIDGFELSLYEDE